MRAAARLRAFVAALAVCVLAGLGPDPALAAAHPTESQRIEALITAVGHLEGAVFIRNGSEHGAAEAAGHLRLKWRSAGSRVRTAEDFIRFCASESSMSGRKYRFRLADGRELESADWFTAELRRFDAAHATRAAMPPAPPEPASPPG